MSVKHGGCLCGEVRYEIDGPIGPLGNCHCETCRKAHAAALATTARVARSDFSRGGGDETRIRIVPG